MEIDCDGWCPRGYRPLHLRGGSGHQTRERVRLPASASALPRRVHSLDANQPSLASILSQSESKAQCGQDGRASHCLVMSGATSGSDTEAYLPLNLEERLGLKPRGTHLSPWP